MAVIEHRPVRPRLRRRVAHASAARALPLTVAGLAAAGYSAGAVFRYERFAAGAYDLGIFDQTVWGYSRLAVVANTIKGVPNLLGDHFHPLVAVAAPLYRVWPDPRALLVLQALLLAGSSLPLHAYARRRLATGAALAVQTAYLAFVGVWSAALFDFHEVAFAPPLLALALWARDRDRAGVFCASCAAGALVKEDVALLFATLALYAAVADARPRRRTAYLLVAALLAVWAVVAVEVVIPALGGRPYAYWSYGRLGSGPGSILSSLVRRPLLPLQLLVAPATKAWTLTALFGSFLFLPLLSPLALLAALPLVERLWNANPNYWSLHYHYSLTLAPILAFAAADALGRLDRRPPAAALPLAAAALTAATLASWPMAALSASASAATDRCLATIPPRASVVATNALVPHLSRRSRIYTFHTLRPGVRPDIVAVNLVADAGETSVRNALAHLQNGYRVGCHGGGTTILVRAAA